MLAVEGDTDISTSVKLNFKKKTLKLTLQFNYQESQAPVQRQPLNLAPNHTNPFSYENEYLLMRFSLESTLERKQTVKTEVFENGIKISVIYCRFQLTACAVVCIFIRKRLSVRSISAALSCQVYPTLNSGEERGLLSRTAAGNRA